MPPPAAAAPSILVLGASGNVGQHVMAELCRRIFAPEDATDAAAAAAAGGGVVVTAGTRDVGSEAARRLLQHSNAKVKVELASVDMGDEGSLEAACQGKDLVFLAMPQPFAPAEMLACQRRLAGILGRTKPWLLVKLSSFGIDDRSRRHVMTQGPLGEAHQQGESLLREAGVPLVSLRPTSFFANFEAYDLPALLRGERRIASPLGVAARVNWVSCEDIGAAAAALLLRALRADGETQQEQSGFEVLDVLGPRENTLSAPDMCQLLSDALSPSSSPSESEDQPLVTYQAYPLPSDEAYAGLWAFLRAGGFDASWEEEAEEGQKWLELVGRPPLRFRDYVRGLLKQG